jgi:hypothetical protein
MIEDRAGRAAKIHLLDQRPRGSAAEAVGDERGTLSGLTRL